MKLSENFTLEEMTVSRTAVMREIDNTPSKKTIENLKKTCEVLEAVRRLLGVPVIITSGYRAPLLNKAVGGSEHSAHMRGFAADFIAPGYGSPYAVAQAIKESGIKYDQLIHEYGNWVHLGLSEDPDMWRSQDLTIANYDSRTDKVPAFRYVMGIHKLKR